MSTKLILIRHGEPRYDEVKEKNLPNMGYELGKLTNRGIEQAEWVAQDPLLKNAELIVSSPYTRALQTAAIISRITQIPLVVEHDLHEWMPDKTFTFDFEVQKSYEEYILCQGQSHKDHKYPWETYEELQKRVKHALNKYKSYQKIIVVCHGVVMSAFTRFDDMIEFCGIREAVI
ncbi:MAG: histidine phosphatase family protein [Acholeplasmataceae bacterium]|jgi:broad specificity phosphatase PhoE|nr:histidine phosphatase family protein [Acholeplasmataceae bacterium]